MPKSFLSPTGQMYIHLSPIALNSVVHCTKDIEHSTASDIGVEQHRIF